jgi:hypothetical protein
MDRLLKVSYAAGGRLDIPMIRLQGIWLRSAGFGVADIIRVEVIDVGHLLIKRLAEVLRPKFQYDQVPPRREP